jgi:hypothetical protein
MRTILTQLTISVAVMRIRLAIEEVGELSACLAAFHNVFVTVFRQSTHVPNTSKNRAFGCGLGAMNASDQVHLKTFFESGEKISILSDSCAFR